MNQVKYIFFTTVISGFLLLCLPACQNREKAKNDKITVSYNSSFKGGKLYDTIRCKKYPDESYALVLPKNYHPGRRYPVVFFFDAHARGLLPVKRYQPLADSFGFILAASNNSKNGLSAQKRNKYIYHFMADVENRFPLDAGRIYTGGFSGGARIAAGIGLSNPGIAGTIGCAAGFPALHTIKNRQLTYVGIVGITDFNYLEMKQLAKELQNANWDFCLLTFDGHHQWPPLLTMKKAFYFLQIDAMRKKIIPLNKNTILEMKTLFEKEQKQAIQQHNLLQQYYIDQLAVKFFNGITDTKSFRNDIQKIENKKSFVRKINLQNRLKEEELNRRQTFSEALRNRDISWWKTTLNNMHRSLVTAPDSLHKQMIQRLYNFLSLMAYLYAEGSLKNYDYPAAQKYLFIYRTVDPQNPEAWFLTAQLKAKTNHFDDVLPLLHKAAATGFHDVNRLLFNKSFSPFHNKKEFKKIVQQVKTNQKTNPF